jgi:tripeptidyl-peptidase-1
MILPVGLLLLVACSSAFELVERSTFATHASREGWQQLSDDADGERPHMLTVALTLRNVDLLEKALLDVSNPDSPRYGQWWSADEISRLSAPAPASVAAVKKWLKAAFGERVVMDDSFEGFIDVTVPIAAAERALNTDFLLFKHAAYNGTLPRAHAYSVPAEVRPHIAFVGNVVRFPSTKRPLKVDVDFDAKKTRNLPSFGVTPNLILDRYDLYNYAPNKTVTKQGIAQFLGQMWSGADLDELYLTFAQSCLGKCEPFKTIGPNSWWTPGVESNLDVQYITSVARGIPTLVLSNETTKLGQEPFLRFAMQLNSLKGADAIQVVSVSYGDDESSLSDTYIQRTSVELLKAGLKGITVLVAAGDSGASCNAGGTAFAPAYPASDPWVTTVGGTDAGSLYTGPEFVNSLSGGGFSNVFSRPPYQNAAFSNWLSTGGSLIPPQQFWNATSRAYPDVAAFSNMFWVFTDLIPSPVAGTSCASPTMAAVIASLNDWRGQNGKPSLGFLNPLLYNPKSAPAFNGIKTGSNYGCSATGGVGFTALPSGAWSPTCGLGSISFTRAQKVF